MYLYQLSFSISLIMKVGNKPRGGRSTCAALPPVEAMDISLSCLRSPGCLEIVSHRGFGITLAIQLCSGFPYLMYP